MPGRAGKPGDLGTLTLEEEVQSILQDASALPEAPVVVVAHSSGGLVVPGVIRGLGKRVSRVVLNAALIPEEGQCGIDCMKPHHREGLLWALSAAAEDGTVVTLPGAPDDPEPLRTAYGGDPLDDETLAFIADPLRTVADTVNHYFQPVSWIGLEHIPVTYVLNERDRPVTPAMQEQMCTHLPTSPEIVRMDSGHIPAVTQPEEIAAYVVGKMRP